MKGWFSYADGPVVGPFYASTKTDVYNEVMDMANSGVAPQGRPGAGDMVALGSTVWKVTEFGFEELASGPAGRGFISAWQDGPVVRPRGDY